MAEACREVYGYIQSGFGNDMTFLIIYAMCLVYLSFCGKKRRCQIVYPSLLITLVIICPPFYKYIWIRLMDYGYWRSFWMIPIIPVYAVTAAEIINKPFSQWGRGLFLVAIAGVFIVTGNNIYTVKTLHSTYEEVDNEYKLPDEVVAIGEALLELDDEPKVEMYPTQYYYYIRQYSSKIRVYWWNVNSDFMNDYKLDSDEGKATCLWADAVGCNYIVLPEDIPVEGFEEQGYYLVKNVMGYDIYANTLEKDNSWEVAINNDGAEPFVSIKDKNGRLSLIDGGSTENNQTLRNYINDNGKEVHSWVFTSLNTSMATAGLQIIAYKGSEVDSVSFVRCSTNINDDILSLKSDEWDINEIYQLQTALTLSDFNGHNLMGLDVQIFNDFSEDVLANSSNVIDDGSLIIRFKGASDSFLYVSDVTQEQLDKVVQQYGDSLSSDYLIINNQHCTEYNALQQAVSPLETYDLSNISENSSFTIK